MLFPILAYSRSRGNRALREKFTVVNIMVAITCIFVSTTNVHGVINYIAVVATTIE